jgi:hypothetical protein
MSTESTESTDPAQPLVGATGDADPPPTPPPAGRTDGRARTACKRPPALLTGDDALAAAARAGLETIGRLVVVTGDLEGLHPGGCPGCAVCRRLLPVMRAGRAAVLEATG